MLLTIGFSTQPFLHFLCTPCGQSASPVRSYSPPGKLLVVQTTAARALNAPSHGIVRICVPLRKSAATVFLNCTKNTELTRALFTRTVSFALSKNDERIPGKRH